MREERNAYPCEYDRLPPYAVRSTPWMGEEDLDKLRLIARAVDRLYNSGRFRRFLDCLIRGEGLRPYELFLRLGLAIRAAENGGAALSLNSLTDLVFSNIADLLPGMAAFLRDLLLLDRLSASPSADLPGCLKRREPREGRSAALTGCIPRPGVLRSLFRTLPMVRRRCSAIRQGGSGHRGYPLHCLPGRLRDVRPEGKQPTSCRKDGFRP